MVGTSHETIIKIMDEIMNSQRTGNLKDRCGDFNISPHKEIYEILEEKEKI